jgi:hypothetical protein
MNIILSSKVAKKLQKEFDLDGDYTPNPDNWRVDCISLEKRSIFIITNEPTLYTCISSFRSGLNGIIQRLASVTNRQDIDTTKISYLKSQNRSLVSSMNNIKIIISQIDKYSRSENERYEELINQTSFKYLSYSTPAELYSSRSRSVSERESPLSQVTGAELCRSKLSKASDQEI